MNTKITSKRIKQCSELYTGLEGQGRSVNSQLWQLQHNYPGAEHLGLQLLTFPQESSLVLVSVKKKVNRATFKQQLRDGAHSPRVRCICANIWNQFTISLGLTAPFLTEAMRVMREAQSMCYFNENIVILGGLAYRRVLPTDTGIGQSLRMKWIICKMCLMLSRWNLLMSFPNICRCIGQTQ